MGELGDDVDRASPSNSHAVEPPNMSTAPGDEAVQGSRRGSEQQEQLQAPEPEPAQTSEQPAEVPVAEVLSDETQPAMESTGNPRNSVPPDVGNTTTPAEPAQSHPMTAITSTSSHLSNKDSTPPPAAYGTRSRNRPGAPRPNYAEDVEMDFETAPQANGGDHSSMDLSSHSPPAIDSRQSPGPGGIKRGTPATNGWNALNSNPSIPGTSLFSANPSARMPHGKKRKAAEVQGNDTGHSQNPAPSSQAMTRRANAAAVNASNSIVPENNMFSFDKCRAVLNKQGKLVADDGTVFSVNGTSLF